ncbi:mannosyltransferase family protein [Patulibacter sp. SYSU D01012]|uniref:mannosyltransferase family protein n=1 Tax=Patulibacter sp. SYSU D01012 TaxID=2817381 RepID=UPI001B300BB9
MSDSLAQTGARGPRGAFAEALGPAWTGALREAVRAFALSRLVVWAAGLLALLLLGWADSRGARLDPLWACRPTGSGPVDVLVAPGCRWDSTWYLKIAGQGYSVTEPARSAFFPLYPLLVNVVSAPLGGALVPAGLLVSWACALGFLTGLHRVVAAARDAATATTVVRVAAYVPPAIFLSAIYTESLFLLLSFAALVAARRDRWALAGLLAAVAASCRSIGILLVVPLAVEYLWGRRTGGARAVTRWWRPRHRLRPDVLWIGLVPLGFLAYAAFLGIATGDPAGAVRAQGDWERTFLTPIGGLGAGAYVIVGRAGDLLGLWYMAPLAPGQVPGLALARDVVLLVMVGVTIAALWWARRRMPIAWVAWGVVSLCYPLSVPSMQQPLMSMPRFILAAFPLLVALGLWAHEGRRMRWVAPTLLVLQALWSVLFVSWTWAA